MLRTSRTYSRILLIAFCCVFALGLALVAQQRFRRAGVEIDNGVVRVVRAVHAPHEKTPMHSHPDSVVVYLTDVRERSTYPDGSSKEITHHAGDAIWSPAHTHVLENLSDKPIEVIEIEIKSASAK